MIKVIFSDFDNTMLDYYSKDNYFDEYKISILNKVREKGIKFCIVTGRSVSFFKQFPNLMDSVDYIMGSNGACIYDVKDDKFIYQDAIDDYEKIIEFTINNSGGFILNCLGLRYKYGSWNNVKCLDYNSNYKYVSDQIVLSFPKEKLKEVLLYLEQFKMINVNNIDYFYNDCVIDINEKSVSKGNAIKWLCDYLNVDLDDTMVFGDGDNDKSMFEVVNKGIAVGNAVDKLKVIAKDVALDCKDNGFYKYIEDNILK